MASFSWSVKYEFYGVSHWAGSQSFRADRIVSVHFLGIFPELTISIMWALFVPYIHLPKMLSWLLKSLKKYKKMYEDKSLLFCLKRKIELFSCKSCKKRKKHELCIVIRTPHLFILLHLFYYTNVLIYMLIIKVIIYNVYTFFFFGQAHFQYFINTVLFRTATTKMQLRDSSVSQCVVVQSPC